jgi:hypothetical protein
VQIASLMTEMGGICYDETRPPVFLDELLALKLPWGRDSTLVAANTTPNWYPITTKGWASDLGNSITAKLQPAIIGFL